MRTFRAALDRLTADPRIDPTRLAVWGTSLSGGHALVRAATDPRINAVAAIIPFIHLTPTAKPDLLPLLARDALRRLTRRPGLMIPAAGHPGEAAAMNSDGAFEWAADMAQGAATYPNEVTVASLPNMLRWSTRKAASNISVPVLAILAEADTITPPQRVRKALQRVPDVEYVSYPKSHFELFTDQGDSVRATTVAWLTTRLQRVDRADHPDPWPPRSGHRDSTLKLLQRNQFDFEERTSRLVDDCRGVCTPDPRPRR